MNSKAYIVDGEEGAVVVFDTVAVRARRRGAQELDLEFDEVESCRRAPELDAYAPGPVPAQALIDKGWWLECSHCGRHLTDDDEPWCDGTEAYCTRWEWLEEASWWARKRGHERMLRNAVVERFPFARMVRATLGFGRRRGLGCTLEVPGLRGRVDWMLGDERVTVDARDAFMYVAIRGNSRPALPAPQPDHGESDA